jgi:hypothetical protein
MIVLDVPLIGGHLKINENISIPALFSLVVQQQRF